MSDDLATLIKARREDLGMSQAELARRVGRAPSTVGSWEQGRTRPTPATLETLAGVLGLAEPGPAGGFPPMEGTAQSNPADSVDEPVTSVDSPPEEASFVLDLTEFEEVVASLDPEPETEADGESEPMEEPDAPLPSLDELKESAEPADEPPMVTPRMAPTTVVVAPTRRRAAKEAARVDGPAAVGTVQPIRTDADPMYRTRALVTLAALGLMGIVFLWAATAGVEAMRDVLDAFMAPFTG